MKKKLRRARQDRVAVNWLARFPVEREAPISFIEPPGGGSAAYWRRLAEDLGQQREEYRALAEMAIASGEEALAAAHCFAAALAKRDPAKRSAALKHLNTLRRKRAGVYSAGAKSVARHLLERGENPRGLVKAVARAFASAGVAEQSLRTLSRHVKAVRQKKLPA